MKDLRKAAEQAIEAIMHGGVKEQAAAVYELRQALAQEEKPPVKSYCGGKPNYCTPDPHVDAVNMSQERVDETAKREHEPYGYLWFTHQMERRFTHYRPKEEQRIGEVTPLYTAPPKREWVGLTDEEVFEFADTNLYEGGKNYGILSFGKAIEAKLKEKNT